MTYKALFLDADGVAIEAPQPYSFTYAEQRGLDPEKIESFFKGGFQDALRGKADLKELIAKDQTTWQWNGDPQELLDKWFAAENVPSIAIPAIITACRDRGMAVYLATNQEKYRAKYLREVMFPNVFDDLLVSYEIGHVKREPEFWQAAIKKVGERVPDIKPQEILYVDDSQSDVDVAAKAGIDARLYEGPTKLISLLGL